MLEKWALSDIMKTNGGGPEHGAAELRKSQDKPYKSKFNHKILSIKD